MNNVTTVPLRTCVGREKKPRGDEEGWQGEIPVVDVSARARRGHTLRVGQLRDCRSVTGALLALI